MILAVIGAQYGSEGKGVIVYRLADQFDVHVRVGGPNAGHSFQHGGRIFKHQCLPVGCVNKNALLVIGAGAVVDPGALLKEVEEADPIWGVKDRLFIDPRATILLPEHRNKEGKTFGTLHATIGSTGEGVGAARTHRIARNIDNLCVLAENWALWPTWVKLVDTVTLLHGMIRNNILLEGTQGSGLSLIHGHYPYVTSHDTNASQLAADCGIPPRRVDRCLLVARTHPIRVHGNSGPLYGEISWEDVSRRMGRKIEERTTVTKKVRRIGTWDDSQFLKACMLNAPTSVALTFMDYHCPEDEGKTIEHELSHSSHRFIRYVETLAKAPVRFVGTGGPEWALVDRGTPL